jgi:hypothetical protein
MARLDEYNSRYWESLQTRNTKSFVCGFCGDRVSSEKGYVVKAKSTASSTLFGVFICPACQHATYFTPLTEEQYPGVAFGKEVPHVPKDLAALYQEARRCTAAASYTSAVLACRKMLMNIAVSEGAKEGQSFLEYVDYLAKKGFVPPNGRHWVDHIRKKGNEANHEIALMKQQDAQELITFVEMLLRFIYEFPNIVPKPAPEAASIAATTSS